MKKLLLVFLLIGLPMFAQHQGQSQPQTGNITAAGSSCNAANCLMVAVPADASTATITISGTWVATEQFEICGDTDANCRSTVGTWTALNGYPVPSGAATSSTTANGVWQANVGGFTMLRVRGSAFTSGTVAAMVTLGFAGTGITGTASISQTDVLGNGVEIAPTASALAGLTPVTSTTTESGHVLKASAGNFYGACVTAGASAGWLLMFDATSAPADGAVTPKEWMQVAANQTACITYNSGPPNIYTTGITAVFSTTGPFTKTASATAAFIGRVK